MISTRMKKLQEHINFLHKRLVEENGCAIKDIPEKYRTNELWKIAIKNNSRVLSYMSQNKQTSEFCLEAVKHDGFQYLNCMSTCITDEIKMEAIKQNGLVIGFIGDPTYEMKKEAIMQSSYAILKIENPSMELKKLAIKNDISLLYHTEFNIDLLELFDEKEHSESYVGLCNNCEKVKPFYVVIDIDYEKIILKDIYEICLCLDCINTCMTGETSEECYYRKIIKSVKDNIFDKVYINFKTEKILELDECPICKEIKKYYSHYKCNEKHIICLDCISKNNKCYYKCIGGIFKNYGTYNNTILLINKLYEDK